MKKILALFCVFILCSAFQCDDEPLEGEFLTENEAACQEASLNAIQAALAFFEVSDENFTSICNSYKEVLEEQISACGDENGSLQAIIDDLGDCILTTNPESIEGTWLLTAWIGEEAIDLNNDGNESTNFLDEMDCYNNETLVFNNEGTGASISTSFADIEIFIEAGTMDSVDFNITCIEEDETVDFTWVQSDNTVSITDTFGTNDWELDGNTLSILIPEGFSVINADDASINTIQDLTFVYTKQ